MIQSLVLNQCYQEAVVLYRDLRRLAPPSGSSEFHPNRYTFPFLLKSCASLPKYLVHIEGSQLHAHILRMGFMSIIFVSTGLIDMYAKAGNLDSAKKVFDEMPVRSPASWTVMSVGYARRGDSGAAFQMFQLMPEKDTVAFNAMIDVFVKSGDLISARKLFDEMPHRNVVSWTTLLSGYCQVGKMIYARHLFDQMPEKNLVSWNAMIGGYNHSRQTQKALELFRDLQSNLAQFIPNEVTLLNIIPAISATGAMDLGRWIHNYAQRKGLDRMTTVSTALVDMYSKCGHVTEAQKIFGCMPRRETASWNAIINGLALNGRAREALDVFMEMQQSDAIPDEITMVGVLSACSHGGLIEEGRRWFKEMDKLGIERKVTHYGCLVDLLGRGGYLEEAEALINNMPCGLNGIVLSSLLFACLCCRDVHRAERVIKMASVVEPENCKNYVMLRNLYAAENRWGDVETVNRLMSKFGTKSETGCSTIEVGCNISEFVAGDRVHPESEMIYFVLRNLQANLEVEIGEDLEFVFLV